MAPPGTFSFDGTVWPKMSVSGSRVMAPVAASAFRNVRRSVIRIPFFVRPGGVHLTRSKGLHKGNLIVFAAMPRIWCARTAVVVAALMAVGVVVTVAQAPDLEVLQLRSNFYMIAGAGANIGVQVGDDGVVVVDSGAASRTDAVLVAIKKLSPRPIRYVIDTSADADHVGGNERLSQSGQT